MDPEIKKIYTEKILREAMRYFDIADDKIELMDGFESFIYAYEHEGGEFILRIGHSQRRSMEDILGEIDWINYLAEGGAGVARAIRSINGRSVESIDDGRGEHFLATAFVRAAGGHPTDEHLNKLLFQSWGRLVGKIHRLSKDYVPTNTAWRRYEWDSPQNLSLEAWLPPSDSAALKHFHALMDHFKTLPKNRDCYGLIHQDAHAGNFFVDKDYQITLFDFDDCVYSWFIYDIAMVLFYGLMGHENDPSHIEYFSRQFLDGYRQENNLDPYWLAKIPYFLKLREIDLYAQIIFSYGGLENVEHTWDQNYLDGRKERIEENLPYIDFDWTSLAR
jgi:Ser/Thr protein kinase RdoA (MazF antagonist)